MTATLINRKYPVELSNLKAWLKVDHAEEDFMITGLIMSSTTEAENKIWKQLTYDTYKISLSDFPEDGTNINLEGEPGIFGNVVYNDGVEKTLSSDNYAVVRSVDGKTWWLEADAWPSASSVTIAFTSGVDPCPENIKTWIMLRCSSLYQQRTAIQMVTAGQSIAEVNSRFYDGLLDKDTPVERLIG